jgi:hypothetical protein
MIFLWQVFGPIVPPAPFGATNAYGNVDTGGKGLTLLFNNIVRLLIVVGGLWAFINLILAGYGFLSAGDDQKKIAASWQKIWQSMLGVLFILGSFVLAAIFGQILFKDPTALLQIKVYGP